MKRWVFLAALLAGCRAAPSPAPELTRRSEAVWTTTGALPFGTSHLWGSNAIFAVPGKVFLNNQVAFGADFRVPVFTLATGTWAPGPTGLGFFDGAQLKDGSILTGTARLDPTTLASTTIPAPTGATGTPFMLARLYGGRALASVPTATGLRYALFDADTKTWKVLTTPVRMDGATTPRPWPVVSLQDDRVLVASDTVFELLDPATDTIKTVPSPGKATIGFSRQPPLLLPSGKLLLVGSPGPSYSSAAEVFDPVSLVWSSSGALSQGRGDAALTLFGSDRVIAIGGRGTGGYSKATDVLRISTGVWTAVGSLATARASAFVTRLDDGRVLTVGGINESGGDGTPSAELFGTLDGQTCTNRLDCVSDQCVDGVCCATACAADEVCNSTAAKGVCKKKNGVTCTAGTQCASGQCVDGVCCNSACGGQCQACDVAAAVGTCTATKGAPHGTRAACTGAGTGTTCGPTCDGSTADKCTFPGASLPCGSNSCVDGFETLASSCDGAGKCAAAPKSCGDYGCDTDRCKTACSVKADCSRVDAARPASASPSRVSATPAPPRPSARAASAPTACAARSPPAAPARPAPSARACASCKTAPPAPRRPPPGPMRSVRPSTAWTACAATRRATRSAWRATRRASLVPAPRSWVRRAAHGRRATTAAATCARRGRATARSTPPPARASRRRAAPRARLPSARARPSPAPRRATPGPATRRRRSRVRPTRATARGASPSARSRRTAPPAHACVDGRCRPKQARCSADKSTAIDVDGKETPCSPFLCRADGRCAEACSLSTDCALGFACDAESRKCIPPAVVEEGGCAMGRSSSAAALPVLLALGLLGRTRRRRSAR